MVACFKSIHPLALFLAFAPVTLSTGCFRPTYIQNITDATHGSRVGESAQVIEFTITTHSGQPIKGARVLVGTRENVPFPGNIFTTNANGKASIPLAWIDPQPITIDAPGFVRATYFGRLPQTTRFKLRGLPRTQQHELSGETTGYSNLARDGFIDIGIVTPALTRAEANTLQMGLLISSETETMSVAGQNLQVPSNISFPTQRESILIPITFSKPIYRMEFDEARTWKIAAVHARFPLRDVMNDINAGKSFFEVVNRFEFKEASIRELSIQGQTKANLPVNEIPYSATVPVAAPSYDSRYSMLSVAFASDHGLYYLADVKRLDPKQRMNLSAPNSKDGIVVNLLRRSEETGAVSEEMSAAILPANRSQTVEFLAVPGRPDLRSGTLVLDPPRAPSSIRPKLTHALLSKVEVSQKDGENVENKVPQWELYAEEWASILALPEMPGTAPRPPGSSRWTVLFAGSEPGSPMEPAGPDALEKVSHVTRSAVDF